MSLEKTLRLCLRIAEFLDAANVPDGAPAVTHQKLVKLVVLLFERIGTKVSDDDVRGMGFVSVGFAQREQMILDTLTAVVRAADALEEQVRLLQAREKGALH